MSITRVCVTQFPQMFHFFFLLVLIEYQECSKSALSYFYLVSARLIMFQHALWCSSALRIRLIQTQNYFEKQYRIQVLYYGYYTL
jgi:hypothetical protein